MFLKNFETVEELYIESIKDAYTNLLVLTVRYDVKQKKAQRMELKFTPTPVPTPAQTHVPTPAPPSSPNTND